jgi:hypothetical protein
MYTGRTDETTSSPGREHTSRDSSSAERILSVALINVVGFRRNFLSRDRR